MCKIKIRKVSQFCFSPEFCEKILTKEDYPRDGLPSKEREREREREREKRGRERGGRESIHNLQTIDIQHCANHPSI